MYYVILFVLGFVVGWSRILRQRNAKIGTLIFAVVLFITIRAIRALIRVEWLETLASDEKFAAIVAIGFFSLIIGFVIGEVIRHLIILKHGHSDAGSSDKLIDSVNSFSERFFGKAQYRDNLKYDARAAIQLSGLVYGTDSNARHRLAICIRDQFGIEPSQASEVSFGLNLLTRSKLSLTERLREFKKRAGKQDLLIEKFFTKFARVGAEAGFPPTSVAEQLGLVAEELGLTSERAIEIMAHVEKQARRSPANPVADTPTASGRVEYQEPAPAPAQTPRFYQPNLKEQQLAKLGLQPSASHDAVETEYQNLSHRYHPETMQAEYRSEREIANATVLMKEFKSAYEWLCVNR